MAEHAPGSRGVRWRARARELCEASADSVRAVGAWCEAEAVDAWYREAPHLLVSAAPAQDGAGAAAVNGREVVALSPAQVRALCDSPVFRSGVAARVGATVHPARLAFGLRERLLARGVRIFEGSRVRALRSDRGPPGAVAETAGGRVRAGAAVVAVNAAAGALAPLRRRLTVASSHIVLTEPVPDVIEALGWTGGEAITDGRALLHYFRTTRDGRILFGWGRAGAWAAAPAPAGAATSTRARSSRPAETCCGCSRASRGAGSTMPGAARSTSPPPTCRSWSRCRADAPSPPSASRGNGVGPAHLAARCLASLSLDRRDDASRLAIVDPPRRAVPPEPLRVAGASLIRGALARKEAAEERGGRGDPASRFLASLPKRLGLHIVR